MRTPDDIHDEWVVLRCQSGEIAALVELVHRWQSRLLRYALRLTGDSDAANDVVQSAWVAILRGLRQLDDPARFRRWAYQITTYKCADWVRQRQRDRARAVPLAIEPIDEKEPVEESEDDTAVVRQALRQLPADHRIVLSMYYLDDMPIEEIAESLSLRMGTVKSRLHYARLKLKIILERRNSCPIDL